MPISDKFKNLIIDNRKEIQSKYPIPNKEELSKMEFVKINELREVYKGNKEIQQELAPYEHRAFTREIISREGGPITKTIGLTAAIPAYYLAKKVGLDVRTTKNEATPASIEQVKQAYIGIGEGLMKIFKNEK